jgi:hypothetical protein
LSHTYNAEAVSDVQLREELARLQRALNDAQPEQRLKVLHEAPSRVFAGMIVYADGADWNPGNGTGMYVRNEANTKWESINAKSYFRFFMLMGA